ncbi:MAG: XRE family transcriptional regulator [Lachnospiraceae bacterium]|nr:XRE family transcriptional regulator [Lachnospiraceae bacterium]
MKNSVIPSRITEAREACALSMGDLADRIGVTRQSVSKYENGIMSPSLDVLQSISLLLHFPIDFFYKQELEVSAGTSPLFFRSKSNIAKKTKTACRYQVKWAFETKQQLERYVEFIDQTLPVIDADYEDLQKDDIENISLSIRRQWGLGDSPIGDLIGILENQGVIISQFSENEFCTFKGIDAYSSWYGGVPYIVYNSIQKSAVRTRFSILHELGHLIMHSSISEEDAVKKEVIDFADMQADQFAASFLLPATSFPKDVRGTSLGHLEIIKQKWGAAMSTIIRRCESLELLTANQLSYLKRQMTTKRYWYNEPLDDVLQIEPPEILRDAVYLLIDNNIITRHTLLELCALPSKDLQCICSLPDDFFNSCLQKQKPMLRIVKPESAK